MKKLGLAYYFFFFDFKSAICSSVVKPVSVTFVAVFALLGLAAILNTILIEIKHDYKFHVCFMRITLCNHAYVQQLRSLFNLINCWLSTILSYRFVMIKSSILTRLVIINF